MYHIVHLSVCRSLSVCFVCLFLVCLSFAIFLFVCVCLSVCLLLYSFVRSVLYLFVCTGEMQFCTYNYYNFMLFILYFSSLKRLQSNANHQPTSYRKSTVTLQTRSRVRENFVLFLSKPSCRSLELTVQTTHRGVNIANLRKTCQQKLITGV